MLEVIQVVCVRSLIFHSIIDKFVRVFEGNNCYELNRCNTTTNNMMENNKRGK